MLNIDTTPTTTPAPTTVQTANQIRNGSYAHSVGSWANNTTADDRRYECAHWYSHPDIPNHPMQEWNSTTTAKACIANPGPDLMGVTAHGFATGDAIVFSTTGTLPAPLTSATYYVIYDGVDTFKVAASLTDAYTGAPIDITDAGTGTHSVRPVNFTLKSSAHAQFSSTETSWNRSTGVAQLNEDYTLDAPLAQPTAEPAYTMFAVFNIAKKNRYVYAPEGARISCGLYGLQNSVWDYLYGDFTLNATVSGTVTVPTTRNYRVHVRTDRGFTIQTPTTTVASAPSDSDFSNGARVVLSWAAPLAYGIVGYDVYRETAGVYKLLDRVTTGLTSYIDNGSFLSETVTAFPAADFTKRYAYTATSDNVIANLATDGVDASWDTVPWALRVPSNYNHSLLNMNRRQWVRWALKGLNSGKLDLRVTDVVCTSGVQDITSAAGQFNIGLVGKTCTLTAKDGTTHTGTIGSFTDANTIGFAFGQEPIFSGTDVEAVIEGGADPNSIYIDLAHLSYGAGAIFAFHPDDLSPDRGVPPVAANGSNQGGTGTPPTGGGGIDGEPHCVWAEEDITITDGAGSLFTVKGQDLKIGDWTFYQNEFGRVVDLQYAVTDIWEIETENDFIARTSDTHKYLQHEKDKGKHLALFKIGDDIFTSIDGKGEVSKVIRKEMVEKNGVVVQIKLLGSHRFLIGRGKTRKWGGIGSHNSKRNLPLE